MEYLTIGDGEALDVRAASSMNARDHLCVVNNLLQDSVDPTPFLHGDGDIVHAGHLFYHASTFQKMAASSLNWHFLDHQDQKRCVSWRASLQVLFFRKGVLKCLSPDTSYSNPNLVVADLAFQVMQRGGVCYFDPRIIKISNKRATVKCVVEDRDIRKFIGKNLGIKSLATVFPLQYISARLNTSLVPREREACAFTLLQDGQIKKIGEYTAIIPTIKRYDYLKKAINSLLNNQRPPAEIIVIDQTPTSQRVAGYYDDYLDKNVKVHFIQKAGQCTARNYGIKHANKEWLLLFDDDSEAWPEMITEHVRLLEFSYADASTGVSLAPWKDRSHIADSINHFHISSVLDTGNCLIAKKSIEDIGMFDLAFDRGSGADDNLGKRLFLDGKVIVFNPLAIRTHYKAGSGGLREHGSWWKNKGTLFGPFPVPTESYNFLKFYPAKYYFRLCLYKLFTSYRRTSFGLRVINTVLFPFKVIRSRHKAQSLLRGE